MLTPKLLNNLHCLLTGNHNVPYFNWRTIKCTCSTISLLLRVSKVVCRHCGSNMGPPALESGALSLSYIDHEALQTVVVVIGMA